MTLGLKSGQLARGSARLLQQVPEMIQTSYPLDARGLPDGLAIMANYWRKRMGDGEIRPVDMRASIIPVACLTSAMIDALLMATPPGDRTAAFAMLCEDAEGSLSGEPGGLILQTRMRLRAAWG